MERGKYNFDLEERLICFAVRMIQLAETLPRTMTGRHIAGQVIRTGTSPAPNYGEAQGAESRSDFIHKNENLSERTARIEGLVENDHPGRTHQTGFPY